MKRSAGWTLAALAMALAAAGWTCLRIMAGHAPAMITGLPSADERPPVISGDPGDRLERGRAAPATDWVKLFHAAGSNYFEFVAGAAQAAYEGDGSAQYFVGRTLDRCEETNDLYRNADDADQAVAHLAYAPALLELERHEYLGCRRFRSENPFPHLPARAGGYPAKYWKSRAVASGYPVAMVAAALESPDIHASQTLAGALATGNPEAMLLFGWTQATSRDAQTTPVMSAAWIFAACERGANCGPRSDVLPSSRCGADIELGCTPDYSVADELTASLKPEELQEARLLARNIQADLRSNDPARLSKYLPP